MLYYEKFPIYRLVLLHLQLLLFRRVEREAPAAPDFGSGSHGSIICVAHGEPP